MFGVTTFKSHILRRDEKGIFGIPFKRLLGAGLGGGLIITLTKIPLPDLSIVLGIVGTILLLILTAPQGGIPRWQRLLYDWRWRLMIAAVNTPQSLLGSVGLLFQIPAEPTDINGDTFFTPIDEAAPRTDLTDWVSFTNPSDAEGMVFIKQPDLRLQ
ncbi:MAG: hypothetical protein ABI947_04590 [Chloroflexota bacterium]